MAFLTKLFHFLPFHVESDEDRLTVSYCIECKTHIQRLIVISNISDSFITTADTQYILNDHM